MNNKIDIKYLLQGYITNSLTDEEKSQLLKALLNPEYLKQFAKLIPVLYNKFSEEDVVYDEEKVEMMIQTILKGNASPGEPSALNNEYLRDTPTVSILRSAEEHIQVNLKDGFFLFLRNGWVRYAAAAVFLGSTGLYGYYRTGIFSTATVKEIATKQTAPADDALPGSDKAILTLSSGKKILLDAAVQDVITDEGVSIHNNNGSLSYSKSNIVAYNTMETPKGGQYKLALSDGTIVWLNAASSITYPTSFPGKTRVVSITGEAYFEVAKNKEMPFRVVSGKQVVEVLGTHFNINAYTDEASVKTTLLEGSVNVWLQEARQSELLNPGQQAVVKYNGSSIVVQPVKVEEAVAWKNGYFMFVDADLASIMRQLARWYDVEIAYEGNLGSLKFGGMVSRSKSIAQTLRILALTGNVRFKVEGRRVTVMP